MQDEGYITSLYQNVLRFITQHFTKTVQTTLKKKSKLHREHFLLKEKSVLCCEQPEKLGSPLLNCAESSIKILWNKIKPIFMPRTRKREVRKYFFFVAIFSEPALLTLCPSPCLLSNRACGLNACVFPERLRAHFMYLYGSSTSH